MDRFAKLHPQVKRVVVRLQRGAREAALRTRCDVLLDADAGLGKAEIARRRRVARSTVYRVLERFAAFGLAGLYDWRRENGHRKIDEAFLQRLDSMVRRSPQDFGRSRPTWTRELLAAVMAEETGVAFGDEPGVGEDRSAARPTGADGGGVRGQRPSENAAWRNFGVSRRRRLPARCGSTATRPTCISTRRPASTGWAAANRSG